MEVEAQTLSAEGNVTPPVAAATPEATTPPATPAVPEGSTPPVDMQTPAFTPDWKFKASGAEHEIPELYRSLVKDQKSLDEIKRLHEKAYGVESLAQNRDSLKKQLSDLQPRLQEYDTVSRNFERLSHFVQNNDFDSFFQALRIPEKAIVQWIQQKIELQDAPPHVRDQYEKNRRLTQEQWEKDQELSHYKSQADLYEQQQAYNTVFSAVGEQAADIAKMYDAKMGEGEFVNFVINKGIQLTQAMGKEPALEQVIDVAKQELTRLGFIQAAAPQAPQAPAVGTTPPQQKPTIPVVPAGGGSPVKQPIKSMDDLLKAAAAMGD